MADNYQTFTERFKPIPLPNGSIERHYSDPEVCAKFDAGQLEYVWTVVSGDEGGSFIIPGFHTVNYESRVLCEVPYSEDDAFKLEFEFD